MNKPILSLLVAVGLIGSASVKADNTWIGGVGLFDQAANWSEGVVPNSERVLINNGGTMLINSNDGVVNFNWLRVGWNAMSGAVIQNGGTVNVGGQPDGNIWVGGSDNGIQSTGIYTLNGGTLNTYGANDLGGTTGSNQLNQNGGIYFDHYGGAIIGNFTYTLNAGSYINEGYGLTIYTGNNNSPAIFNQNGGIVHFSGTLTLGRSNDFAHSQYNLNGGFFTLDTATPFQFFQAGGGASFNFLSTGTGQLDLLGSWNYGDLAAIPNADFTVDNSAASSSNLTFTPTTINGTEYTEVQAAPEPSTYALFGIGAIGMLMVMRRKKTA
jgi:PEP-CTERM motif